MTISCDVDVRDRLVERWILTQQRYHKENVKRVYYLSMGILSGALLGSNIQNLGLTKPGASAARRPGHRVDKLRDDELDAGLGNAGLWHRFLDSMATL